MRVKLIAVSLVGLFLVSALIGKWNGTVTYEAIKIDMYSHFTLWSYQTAWSFTRATSATVLFY